MHATLLVDIFSILHRFLITFVVIIMFITGILAWPIW